MDEFKVRVAPKTAGKKLSIFRMHKDDHVTWAEAKMKRENEKQPWQIKTGSGRTSKRFKANRVGSVDENSDFFIFYKPKGSNDTLEVCPVDEWYNVAADKRYKTLTAEEAEDLFNKREKRFNNNGLMKATRRNGDGDEGQEGYSRGTSSFRVSDKDDWDGPDDDFSGSEAGDDANGDEDGVKKKKKSVKKEKGDQDEVPEEGKEDSDEGDFEQREVDYMSETSSDSDQSAKSDDREEGDMKGIDEEQAIRDLLDDSDEDEEGAGVSPEKGGKSSASKGQSEMKRDPDGNESDEASDDDDDDYDGDEDEIDSKFFRTDIPSSLLSLKDIKLDPELAGSSGTGSQMSSSSGQKGPASTQQAPAANKRKQPESSSPGASTSSVVPPPKRPCPPDHSTASSASTSPPNSVERMIEDLIKKYLRRKPTTLKTLLRDIKSKLKRLGGSDLELKGRIHCIADIIKRLNPEKQKTNGETYLSLKS